jgi:hypothetical protein
LFDALPRDQRRDLADRIEDARGRLAMDGEDVGDRLVAGQQRLDRGEIRRRVLRRLVRDDGAAGDLGDLLGAVTVGAVDQHQQLAGSGHEGGDHRLDGEGAAALHRHGDMRALGAGELDDAVEHHLVDADELGVARAPVVHHRLLHRGRGGERAGRQQQGIAGFGSAARGHGGPLDWIGRKMEQ